MFLNLPHQASRYYGTLLKSLEKNIFVPGHPPIAYYASALALYRFESLVRKKLLDPKYRPFKYQLLAMVRMSAAGLDMPAMSSNRFERYCDEVVAELTSEKRCTAAFCDATKVLDRVLAENFARDKAKDVSVLASATEIFSQRKAPSR